MKNKSFWITSHSRLEQTDDSKLWRTLDNQLFSDNGVIYLVPRLFVTDGYTIPDWIAWLGGGKMEWDTRCSTQHDFECKYAQVIKVDIPLIELKKRGILKIYENKIICENIPIEFLTVEKTTFNQTNNRFKRMLIAAGTIPKWRINLMRFAVNFNFGWHSRKKNIDLNNIYIKEI